MTDDIVVEVHVSPDVHEKANEVLAEAGLTISEAVLIMLQRTAHDLAVPRGIVEEDPEYDAWFRAKVQEALDDPRPDIDGEEVERIFAEKRAALRARLAG